MLGKSFSVEKSGRGLIRRDHEIFNDVAGAILLARGEIQNRTFRRHHRMQFHRLERERPGIVTADTKYLRRGILQFQLCLKLRTLLDLRQRLTARFRHARSCCSVKPRGHGVVGQLRLVLHDCRINSSVRYGAILRDQQLGNHRKPLRALVQ